MQGAELFALRSIDWSRMEIHLITMEDAFSPPAKGKFLLEQGYHCVFVVGLDSFFVRRHHLAAAKRWYQKYDPSSGSSAGRLPVRGCDLPTKNN